MPGAATSGWLIQRRSKTGRSERMGGSQSKLWWAGGDDVAHSRECASHGSAPHVAGERRERTTLIPNGTNDRNSTSKMIDPIKRFADQYPDVRVVWMNQ